MKKAFVVRKKGKTKGRPSKEEKICQAMMDYYSPGIIKQANEAAKSAMLFGSAMTKVSFNGEDYSVPSFSSSNDTGWWMPNSDTISVSVSGKEKPMKKLTKDAQILELERVLREKDECVQRLRSERDSAMWKLEDSKRASRNPVIKTLKAISIIPLAPVLVIAAILNGLVDCGNDTFNRVFKIR